MFWLKVCLASGNKGEEANCVAVIKLVRQTRFFVVNPAQLYRARREGNAQFLKEVTQGRSLRKLNISALVEATYIEIGREVYFYFDLFALSSQFFFKQSL
jgi:hypothetical protein